MIPLKIRESWSWPVARWFKLTIEEAIYYKLSTEVITLGGRVYPVTIEQGCALPAVAYKRISTRRDPTLTSQGGRFVSVQFDIIASDYTTMRQTRDLVRIAFEDIVGQYAVDAPYIQSANIVNEMDGFDTGTEMSLGVLEIEFYYTE